MAGDSSRGRSLRPAEAIERVLVVCERGPHRLAERDAERGPSIATIARWGLVAAFRAGFPEAVAPSGPGRIDPERGATRARRGDRRRR